MHRGLFSQALLSLYSVVQINGALFLYLVSDDFQDFICNILRVQEHEAKWECLSEATASHSHKTSAAVSFSAAQLLPEELSIYRNTQRCSFRVLCPVRRPVTAMQFVLLKDSNPFLSVGLGPKIYFQSSLWIRVRTSHTAICWLSIQLFILYRACRPSRPFVFQQTSKSFCVLSFVDLHFNLNV